LLAGSCLLIGCGGGADETANPGLSGRIVVDGSSTVFRISKAAQVAYSKTDGQDVEVLVGNHGTGGGFGRYLQGEVDIVDASRMAKPEEESQAKEKGLDWTRFTIAYDGITVVVNPTNTFVKSLTVEQLKKLFEPDSQVTTWNQLDPSWPDRKIVLYTPDNDSGTYEFFVEAIIGQKAQRKDVQASSEDNVLVTGVAGDADGLGYFGYAYYAANKTKLSAVAIQDGPDAQPVAPDHDTILNQTYKPLARPLYLYVKTDALRKRPEVAHFLRYYLDNLDKLVTTAGYVPATAADKKENATALAEVMKTTTPTTTAATTPDPAPAPVETK
jgi:phosphate transport system substrate-binding protein